MEKYDWHFPIKMNTLMLRLVGLWPKSDSYKFNWYLLYSYVSIALFIYGHNFFQTFNIYFIIDDLNAVTATIFVALTDLLGILKSYSMFKSVPTLKQLLKKINTDEMFQPKNEEQIEKVEEIVNFWKLIYKVFFTMAVFTIFFWAIFPIMDGTVKDYRLPFLAWYPYDHKKTPYYEITYIYQILSVCFIATLNLHVDTLIAALMMFIAAQCVILKINLENLHKGNDIRKDFFQCIQHHREIVMFVAFLSATFFSIVLAQFFTSAVSIGLTMFQLSVVSFLSSEFYSFFFYGLAVLVQIFMYCWFGNEVELKSSLVPYAAYEFDWNDTSLEVKKNLLFFIRRTQRPIKISAFNLFCLSLDTFTRILRTAWSYFAVLHQVNAKGE